MRLNILHESLLQHDLTCRNDVQGLVFLGLADQYTSSDSCEQKKKGVSFKGKGFMTGETIYLTERL